MTTTPTPDERHTYTPPAPVIFQFDKKKPKPDQYAAYTILQLHQAFSNGVAARTDSMVTVPRELSSPVREVLIDRFERARQGQCLMFDDIWRDLIEAATAPEPVGVVS